MLPVLGKLCHDILHLGCAIPRLRRLSAVRSAILLLRRELRLVVRMVRCLGMVGLLLGVQRAQNGPNVCRGRPGTRGCSDDLLKCRWIQLPHDGREIGLSGCGLVGRGLWGKCVWLGRVRLGRRSVVVANSRWRLMLRLMANVGLLSVALRSSVRRLVSLARVR